MDAILEPGDLLYFPRGVIHQVKREREREKGETERDSERDRQRQREKRERDREVHFYSVGYSIT